MLTIVSQGSPNAYGVVHYIADVAADMNILPPHVSPGSTCLVLETGQKYIMNTVRAWVFIGTGSGNAGGGGGVVPPETATTDYNKLTNIPIDNVAGTVDAPIVFQNLAFGNYNISGSYIYTTADANVKTAAPEFYIEVLEDDITKEKIVKIEDYEDGAFYVKTIRFNGTAFTETKIYPSRTTVVDLTEF